MKKIVLLVLSVALVGINSGCAGMHLLTAEEASPTLANKTPKNIAIAVVDHRPYVVAIERKDPSYYATEKGDFGIPVYHYLENKEPMSDYLSARLSAAMKKNGANVEVIKTSPSQSLDEVAELLMDTNKPSLQIELLEWQFRGRTDGLWWACVWN